jgi:hypothetical protein
MAPPMTRAAVQVCWAASDYGRLGSNAIDVTVSVSRDPDGGLLLENPLRLEIRAADSVPLRYTVTFSRPVKGVAMKILSLGTTLIFDRPVYEMSGRDGFAVDGSSVSGVEQNGGGRTDSDGAVFLGDLQSFSFTSPKAPIRRKSTEGVSIEIYAGVASAYDNLSPPGPCNYSTAVPTPSPVPTPRPEPQPNPVAPTLRTEVVYSAIYFYVANPSDQVFTCTITYRYSWKDFGTSQSRDDSSVIAVPVRFDGEVLRVRHNAPEVALEFAQLTC